MAANATAQRTAFLNSVKKNSTLKKKFQEDRKAAAGAGGGKPNIDDGIYPCKITASVGMGDRGKLKGQPLVTFHATVIDGDFKGVSGRRSYAIAKDEWAQPAVIGLLKLFLPDQEDEIGECNEPADYVPFIDALSDSPPTANVSFTNDGEYINIRINEIVDSGEDSTDETATEEAGDETEDSTEEEGTEEEAGDDEAYEPEKDDPVVYRVKGKNLTCTVVSVNRAKSTANLKTSTGTLHKLVPWDKLKPAE